MSTKNVARAKYYFAQKKSNTKNVYPEILATILVSNTNNSYTIV